MNEEKIELLKEIASLSEEVINVTSSLYFKEQLSSLPNSYRSLKMIIGEVINTNKSHQITYMKQSISNAKVYVEINTKLYEERI